MNKLRVFVADDSPVARNMLIRMLHDEEDVEIVGEAGTTQSCIMMLDEVNPDIILLEAAISGGMSISRLIRSIKEIKPYVKIILCVEINTGEEMIKTAMQFVHDIVRKPYNKANMLRAIRNA